MTALAWLAGGLVVGVGVLGWPPGLVVLLVYLVRLVLAPILADARALSDADLRSVDGR